MEAAGGKLAAEIEALNAELARLADASTASGARKDSLRAELADCTAKCTEAQVAQAAAEAAGDTARQRLPSLEQSARDAAAQLEETKQDLADTVKYRQTLEENEKQLGNIRSGLELKLRSRKAALDEADAVEQRLGRELDAARQRLSVLRELEKNMDGYQNSVRAVMRAAGARRLRGILGPVSTILKVEPGCEVAIETALGGALQNIVVENEAAAKAAIALLRNDHAGRATFLPLDTVQPGVFRGRLSGTARLASALVQADPRYENIVSNLLGRIIVVEDINEASRVARDNGYHNKVVTMDGQVINAGGSFTGGSVQRSAGLFTRKQEMEELRLKAAKLQKDCIAAQEKTDQCKEQADALQAELTATASEQITAANDRVRAEAEQKRLEAAAAQLAPDVDDEFIFHNRHYWRFVERAASICARNFRNWYTSMKKATTDAIRSDSGIAHHTPQLPSQRVWTSKIWGRKISPGIRNSSWRESDRKIALPAMPMLMKKLVATIWNPMIGKQTKTMRIPSTASRMRRGSLPAKSLGVTGPRAKPSAAAAVASSSAVNFFIFMLIPPCFLQC